MLLALSATTILIAALLLDLAIPAIDRALERRRFRRQERATAGYDPGRERRAERRARELLRSCVNRDEWEMYDDLGFIRVWGKGAGVEGRGRGVPYAYLVYPHKPIVAYLPQTGELLSEYCVDFRDESRPYGSPRLPESDDVLAKWMALTGDERRVISTANMHLPGRQVDPRRLRRDIWRLREWERARVARAGLGPEGREHAGGSVPAS
jgi:hypothetical protein